MGLWLPAGANYVAVGWSIGHGGSIVDNLTIGVQSEDCS